MTNPKKFNDETWTENEWEALLKDLISKKLVSWKDITALVLGHMNPSQVGTSLASSEGFKQRYGKGNVMSKVMEWFYEQNGKCYDCGTRLELQADHSKPREEYENRLDADFIENIVLRCRRCNVVRRPSHEFVGQTYLTTESALMWILFSFQPRTLPDFVRMCRLYGMTMADVRMQEGWAMAHWLQNTNEVNYVIDANNTPCQILGWTDGGLTRCWAEDHVPDKTQSRILFNDTLPSQHLIALAYLVDQNSLNARVQVFRCHVGKLPFSHYFPQDGAEILAITYTSPKRVKENNVVDPQTGSQDEILLEDALMVEELSGDSERTLPQSIRTYARTIGIEG